MDCGVKRDLRNVLSVSYVKQEKKIRILYGRLGSIDSNKPKNMRIIDDGNCTLDNLGYFGD